MKAKYILIILAVFVQVISCKKEEEPTLILDKNDITLHHDEKSQLTATATPEQSCIWSSLDTNVAVVSQTGLVTGVRIGDTKIIVKTSESKLSSECTVHVTARSFLYKEPYFVLGQTKSYVKGKESRTLEAETSDGLLYLGENSNIRYVVYMFENNALTAADVMLINSTSIVDEAFDFLEERYIFIGYVDIIAFFSDGKGTLAALNYDDTLGLNVLYYNENERKIGDDDFRAYLVDLKQILKAK